jgi:hypothetical protein
MQNFKQNMYCKIWKSEYRGVWTVKWPHFFRFIISVIIIISKMIKQKQQEEENTFFMHEFIPWPFKPCTNYKVHKCE